jgi:hypothetical protein
MQSAFKSNDFSFSLIFDLEVAYLAAFMSLSISSLTKSRSLSVEGMVIASIVYFIVFFNILSITSSSSASLDQIRNNVASFYALINSSASAYYLYAKSPGVKELTRKNLHPNPSSFFHEINDYAVLFCLWAIVFSIFDVGLVYVHKRKFLVPSGLYHVANIIIVVLACRESIGSITYRPCASTIVLLGIDDVPYIFNFLVKGNMMQLFVATLFFVCCVAYVCLVLMTGAYYKIDSYLIYALMIKFAANLFVFNSWLFAAMSQGAVQLRKLWSRRKPSTG